MFLPDLAGPEATAAPPVRHSCPVHHTGLDPVFAGAGSGRNSGVSIDGPDISGYIAGMMRGQPLRNAVVCAESREPVSSTTTR